MQRIKHISIIPIGPTAAGSHDRHRQWCWCRYKFLDVVILMAALGVYCYRKNKAKTEENDAPASSTSNIKRAEYEGEGIEGIIDSIFETKTANSKKELKKEKMAEE